MASFVDMANERTKQSTLDSSTSEKKESVDENFNKSDFVKLAEEQTKQSIDPNVEREISSSSGGGGSTSRRRSRSSSRRSSSSKSQVTKPVSEDTRTEFEKVGQEAQERISNDPLRSSDKESTLRDSLESSVSRFKEGREEFKEDFKEEPLKTISRRVTGIFTSDLTEDFEEQTGKEVTTFDIRDSAASFFIPSSRIRSTASVLSKGSKTGEAVGVAGLSSVSAVGLIESTQRKSSQLAPEEQRTIIESESFEEARRIQKETERQSAFEESIFKGIIAEFPFVPKGKKEGREAAAEFLESKGFDVETSTKALKRQDIATESALTGALLGGEKAAEFFGRQGFSKAFRSGAIASKGSSASNVVKGKSGPILARAGFIEGTIGGASESFAQEGRVNPVDIAIGGAAGSIIAPVVGKQIAASRVAGNKAKGTALEGFANIADPLEFPGDVLTTLEEKSFRAAAQKAGSRGESELVEEFLSQSPGKVRVFENDGLIGIKSDSPSPIEVSTISGSQSQSAKFSTGKPVTSSNIPTRIETEIESFEPIKTPISPFTPSSNIGLPGTNKPSKNGGGRIDSPIPPPIPPPNDIIPVPIPPQVPQISTATNVEVSTSTTVTTPVNVQLPAQTNVPVFTTELPLPPLFDANKPFSRPKPKKKVKKRPTGSLFQGILGFGQELAVKASAERTGLRLRKL